ncbi:MAG: CPBP family intramembrane metalloprotease [Phycisphaerae bacterium]|nr:CPBP family intramembrane metalloprotease [Phycisphaerae bacterium]
MALDESLSRELPKARAWSTLAAVLAILFVTAFQLLEVELGRLEERAPEGPVPVGRVDLQVEILSRMRAAASSFGNDSSQAMAPIAEATEPWRQGSISQRLARAIVLATCEDHEAAIEQFTEAAEAAKADPEVEAKAAPLLRVTASLLRGGGVGGTAREGAATVAERIPVAAWPPPGDDDELEAEQRLGFVLTLGRAELVGNASAQSTVRGVGATVGVALVLFMLWIGAALLGGFAALVTLITMALIGSLRLRTGPGVPASAVLLEVFAIFMSLFLIASSGLAAVVEHFDPLREFVHEHRTASIGVHLVVEIGAAWLALAWWRWRGGSWRSLRALAGLDLRAGFWRTTGIGFVGYALALVLGLGGLIVSLLLAAMVGEERLGDPKHPIHEVILGDDAGAAWMVLALGVIVAPILEEIFFRGALYRGLRDRLGSRGAALVAGSLGAVIVSSSIFAIIHPQGVLFAPILAGLGAGFCLVREWSGSVAPGILAHALNNGIMLGFVIVLTN